MSVDSAEESRALAEKLDISFPLLRDEGMRVMAAYGVADADRDIAVPSIFIVGKDRTILWSHVGESITDRPSAKKILTFLDGR